VDTNEVTKLVGPCEDGSIGHANPPFSVLRDAQRCVELKAVLAQVHNLAHRRTSRTIESLTQIALESARVFRKVSMLIKFHRAACMHSRVAHVTHCPLESALGDEVIVVEV
jgi:hypothetical protein